MTGENCIHCAAICPIANRDAVTVQKLEPGPVLATQVEVKGVPVELNLRIESFDRHVIFSVASLLETEVPEGAVATCELPEILIKNSQTKGSESFTIYQCPYHFQVIDGFVAA